MTYNGIMTVSKRKLARSCLELRGIHVIIMAQLFGLLRPFCVALAQNPSLENASRLKKELQALGESDLPHELFEYILFPLNLVLQTSSCRLPSCTR